MTLRVGVVGAGYLGARHAERLSILSGARLVGLHDRNMDQGASVAQRLNCRNFTSLEALIQSVDAVIVAVPAKYHFGIAIEALRAGRAAFVEKPLAIHPDEGALLVSLASERGVVLQVGHIERFNPAFMVLQQLTVSPRFIEIHRLSPFGQRGIETDVVLEVMIHDLDLVLTLVREPVVSVLAVGVSVLSSRNDIANVRLTFAGGCVANLTASRVSLRRMRKLRIFQPGEYLSADLETKDVARIVRRSNSDGSVLESISTPVYSDDALTRELEDFVTAVVSRSRPRVDGAAGQTALELAWRVFSAMESGADGG